MDELPAIHGSYFLLPQPRFLASHGHLPNRNYRELTISEKELPVRGDSLRPVGVNRNYGGNLKG